MNKSSITVRVYPGGDHAVEDPRTHRVQQRLLDDLVEFIRGASEVGSGY